MSQLQMFVSMKAAAGGGLSPGAAYTETWSLTAATVLGNAIYQGYNGGSGTLTDKKFDVQNGTTGTNALYTGDLASDQLYLATDSSNIADRYFFSTMTLNGATYTPANMSAWTDYFDDGEGGITYPSGTWTNGTNSATVNKLTNGNTYNVVWTAYVLNGSITFTIGTQGSAPGRLAGYRNSGDGAIGTRTGGSGDEIWTIAYNEVWNKTNITGVNSSGKQYRGFGPSIKALYNGVETTLTEAAHPTTPYIGSYWVAGDPFSLLGNNGASRTIQYVSVGS